MTRWLGEGDTPLIELPRLAAEIGVARLWAKCEHHNPTGSYKDRIAAATMSAALRNGHAGWIATSSGNAGMSMAAYGRRAGLPGILCILADAPPQKLASIRPYGITVLPMSELGPGEMEQLEQLAIELDLMLGITAYRFNPEGMRGAEAIGRELASLPTISHVYVPTGGGGLAAATGRGLADAGSQAALVVAQPAGCAPVARFLAGSLDEPRVAACTTAVSGLQLPDPPDAQAAIFEVRRSGGWGASVADSAAWAAQDRLAAVEGIFVEPAAAVSLAAVAADVRCGRLPAEAEPCLVLTGSGLKDLTRFSDSAASGGTAAIVASTDLAAEVRAALRVPA